MSRIDEILAQVGEIKPLPGTVLKLIQVVNDPRSTVNDIVETIRYDQAATTHMLRLCNSAYWGLPREIHSLNEAIRFLGMMKVLQLVMAIHSNALLSRGQAGYSLPPGVLWKHSVAVALASSAFAQRVKLENANAAFTAGLLHDIGKVVLNEHVAEEFREIVTRITEQKVGFTDAEREVLGFSHAEIGARVAEKWQLPDAIARCVRYHHEPGEIDPPDPLVDTVYLADCICLLLGIGLGSDGLSYHADEAVAERYNLAEQDLEIIGAQVMTELKRVEQTFTDTSQANARTLTGAK